jgi:hypothetical protein
VTGRKPAFPGYGFRPAKRMSAVIEPIRWQLLAREGRHSTTEDVAFVSPSISA